MVPGASVVVCRICLRVGVVVAGGEPVVVQWGAEVVVPGEAAAAFNAVRLHAFSSAAASRTVRSHCIAFESHKARYAGSIDRITHADTPM